MKRIGLSYEKDIEEVIEKKDLKEISKLKKNIEKLTEELENLKVEKLALEDTNTKLTEELENLKLEIEKNKKDKKEEK